MLAAVSAGLYLGWRSPELVTPSTRIQIVGFWEILTFALNADGANWGGYWSKQGPELLEHRAATFETEQRMVFRSHHLPGDGGDFGPRATDPNLMGRVEPPVARECRRSVVSSTLDDTLGSPLRVHRSAVTPSTSWTRLKAESEDPASDLPAVACRSTGHSCQGGLVDRLAG